MMNDTPLHSEPLVCIPNRIEWPHRLGETPSLVIFGLHDFAQLAYEYLKKDYDISFTVDAAHLPHGVETYQSKKIIAWEELKPCLLFAPISDKTLRQRIYTEGKERGFKFISYVSPHATVLTESIGENCFILEDNTIQPFVNIGNNVVLWSGNHIGHHSYIGAFSTITSHCVVCGHVRIGEGCYIGVNSSIRDGLSIAGDTFIGQQSNVVKSITEPGGVYYGNPAKEK